MEIPAAAFEKVNKAQSVTVLTGAGISAESNIPTFRDAMTGLWARYDATQLATASAFASNPQLVWQWYEWRRDLIRQAAPNPAHHALVELETRVPKFTLITQNVDGLHALAGNNKILELHGNIFRNKCFQEDRVVEMDQESEQVPPRCPKCGSYLRPDVVWFGESLPMLVWQEAIRAARSCELFVLIGTSGIVQPAASLPMEAYSSGAYLIEINIEETTLTPYVHCSLIGKAGELLPSLLRQAFNENTV